MSNEALLLAGAALLLVLGAVAAVAAWLLDRRLAGLEDAIAGAEARGREQAERLRTLAQWRSNQEFAEHAVDTGTSVVRAVHKGIAAIPFSILESIPSTAPGTRAVRQVHDAISDGIYAAIAGLNKAVGRELRKGMGAAGTPQETAIADSGLDAKSGDKRSGT